MSSFDTFFDSYMECLLWSTSDINGDTLDDDYGTCDIEAVCLQNIKKEALDFFYTSRHLWYMTPDSYSLEQHGHDFALTRNGHGAGYWDRGLGRLGKELTDHCKAYGNCDLYAGDEGQLYAYGFES